MRNAFGVCDSSETLIVTDHSYIGDMTALSAKYVIAWNRRGAHLLMGAGMVGKNRCFP